MAGTHTPRRQALQRHEQQYEKVKAEILALGYVLQGSVIERWKACGKTACRCHADVRARHGPYYQWSWKSRGRTVTVYLDKEQAALCKRWIANNRRLERILARIRSLSLRVARLYKLPRP
jgi:hypothetical protein